MITVTSAGMQTKERNITIDALKGLGIILMVLGHSGFPFTDFIYQFHMAAFFMASGYLWNDKKVADFYSFKKGVVSCIKRLWLPYVLVNCVFALFNNLFVAWHIYVAENIMSPVQIGVNIVKILFFIGHTQMGGSLWFLRALFLISVGHLILRYIFHHRKAGRVLFVLAVVAILAGTVLMDLGFDGLPSVVRTFFCGYTAFLLGTVMRRLSVMDLIRKHIIAATLLAMLALLLLSPIAQVEMGLGKTGPLPFFMAISLAGWFSLWGIASFMKGVLVKFVAFCGRNSVWIVSLHFVAFLPVTALYIAFTDGNFAQMSVFPSIPHGWLWVAYTVVGVAIPLAAFELTNTLKSVFRR